MNASLTDNTVEDGFDRQNIAVIKQRFLAVNEDRLERMRGALTDRAQLFMDILPLLFHTNHPMMPGFVSRNTPAKVTNFTPSKRDVLVGKMVAKSFTLSSDPAKADDIFSIYIMGSVGTIAQSDGSDLDIWICHRPGLHQNALAELEKKCQKISRWAMERMRLEVHFFLMDDTAYKTKKFSTLNKESSGSAQQLLLLDEFYRSAIFIAGRLPLWWFVPPGSESIYKEHANTLLYKRFLPNDSIVDFGGVNDIQAGEFLGAGIWQLYKAIESPYKSVLKLLLLESYVAEFPDIEPLSLTFKSLIYDGEYDISVLDSYVMIYHRIERYLIEKKQPKRLELARRCFYFKTNKALSRPPSKTAKSWQRILLENLTENWGWHPNYIRYLDSHPQWKAADVQRENNILISELNNSYRFLMDFASDQDKSTMISSDELIVLGRKLQAAFERRPGKIDSINPGISKDLSESVLVIAHARGRSDDEIVWTAFSHEAGVMISDSGTPLKSSENLIELLFWCYFNEILTRETRVELSESTHINRLELRRLLSAFNEWQPRPLKQIEHNRFQKTAAPEKVLFLINAGKSPTPDLDSKGYQHMSDKTDALRYGGSEENLVVSIDVIVKNSWNEFNIRRFEGEDALHESIIEYLHMTIPGTHQKPPQIRLVCIGSAHGNTITQRVEKLFNDITRCFFTGRDAQYKRFVFQLGPRFHCLQFKGKKPHIRSFRSQNHLVEHMEEEQKNYSPIVVDTQALVGHPIHSIALISRPKSVDVYFRRFDIGTEIFVSDEYGSILHTAYRGRKDHDILKPLHRFLRSVVYRQANLDPGLADEFGILPINFIEISKGENSKFQPKVRKINADTPSSRLELKATAYIAEDNAIHYNFHCDGQDFHAQSFDKQVEFVVSQYIISRRTNAAQYPVYLSDLDLSLATDLISQNHRLQIVHYLRIRNRLESRLNKAIGILLDA